MSNSEAVFDRSADAECRARTKPAPAAAHLAMAASLLLGLAACQAPPTQPAPDAAPPQAIPEVDQGAPASAPEISITTAIDLLQTGQEAAAREMLTTLGSNRPGSIAARLLRQIDSPIDELLPGPYESVTIEAGETLSRIALRVLGDPLMFYALARLNRIEQPNLVAAGDAILVPRRAETIAQQPAIAPEPAVAIATEPDVPSDDVDPRIQDIETVARYLVRSGRPDEAWGMLMLEIESGESGSALVGILAELTLARADELTAGQRFDEAAQRLERVVQALASEDPNRLVLERKLEETASAELLSRARRAREAGNSDEAYRLARDAQRIGAHREAAALADDLRAQLIDTLHNDALIAWRDRDVDRAIRQWERLLESVPDFNPAKVYLERAYRLRARLDRS